MKNLIIYCFFSLIYSSCCAQKKNVKGDQLPKYPKEKQISYVAHMNSKTPYELYLDDQLIDWELKSDLNKTVEFNPYLLSNGTHILKILFFPPETREDKLVHPKDIVFDEYAKWNLYFIKLRKDASDPLGYSGQIDYQGSELPVVAPTSNVPVWEQEFKVKVTDLPYTLKGWSDGEDLSKLDQKELEQEALAYFNKLKDLLNNGKIEEFMSLNKTNDMETSTSIYENQKQYDDDYRTNVALMTKKCIGNMVPIDQYEMKIYGNGKTLRLEIPDGKYKHWSVLRSESKQYGKASWGIMVYRPKGSKEFVIIRN